MIEYKFAESHNREKLFLIRLSDIEGRLDPHPYHPERISAIEKLKHLECIKLKNVVVSNKTITTEINEDDTYVGLENIISNTGEYIATEDKTSISSAAVFHRGQILFPKLRPYLNKVFLAQFDGLCSTEFHVFDAVGIEPEFLVVYLRSSLVVSQTKHLMTGNTLPRLQTEDINNIPVPKLPIEKQKIIIEKYQSSINVKLQKEEEARSILSGLDSYLLSELGISLEENDNSLTSRVFTTHYSKVSGNRSDCSYYLKYYSDLERSIEGGRYSCRKLGKISVSINSGKTPASSEYSQIETPFPIIKVGSYTKDYIDLSKVDYTESTGTMFVHKNDIFILSAAHQAEYVGRHIKFLDIEPEVPTSFVGELICVRVDESICNPLFLFSLLSTNLFKTLINRERTGQTSHIYSKDIKHIMMPSPPIDRQNEIALNINFLREKVRRLQEEAMALMVQANKDVEKLIMA